MRKSFGPLSGKLLGIFTLGYQVAEHCNMRRLFSKLAVAITLTVVMGILFSILLGCVLYGCYMLLVNQGTTDGMALATVALLTLFIALALLFYVQSELRSASQLMGGSIHSRVRPIADSFLDGLLDRPAKIPKAKRFF